METTFDKIADIYDKVIPEHISLHYLKKRINFINRYIDRGLVLDVGCGTGTLDRHLIKENLDIVGLDLSKNMLLEAKKKVSFSLICGDCSSLPFKSGTFNLVISVVILHHIADKKKIYLSIREMMRVLKSGGKVIIWEHNPLNPYWPIFMKRLPQDYGIIRLIPLKEIVKNLEGCGTISMEIYRKGFLPDFIPHSLLIFFEFLEKYLERTLGIRKLSAHNIIVAQKS